MEATTDIVSFLADVRKPEAAVVISDFVDKWEHQIKEWESERKKREMNIHTGSSDSDSYSIQDSSHSDGL